MSRRSVRQLVGPNESNSSGSGHPIEQFVARGRSAGNRLGRIARHEMGTQLGRFAGRLEQVEQRIEALAGRDGRQHASSPTPPPPVRPRGPVPASPVTGPVAKAVAQPAAQKVSTKRPVVKKAVAKKPVLKKAVAKKRAAQKVSPTRTPKKAVRTAPDVAVDGARKASAIARATTRRPAAGAGRAAQQPDR